MFRKLQKNVSGNASVVFALSVVLIFSLSIGSLDAMRAYNMRNNLQTALDAAVLSGIARSKNDADETALKVFNDNATSINATVDQTYEWNDLPQSDTSQSIIQYHGMANLDVKTNILGLIGIEYIHLSVNSTAQKISSSENVPCIYVLDPSGSQSLLINSGAHVNAKDCEIDVFSVGNPSAIFNSGSDLNFSKVCIGGDNIIQNSTTVKNLSLNCKGKTNPYAGKIAPPTNTNCTYSNLNYSGNVTLNPGVYCGWFNFNSGTNVNFNPGTYVIKNGGWNVNGGSFTGQNVTFYFADASKIQFNSGMTTKLTAPTSGSYKGILMFENESNPKGGQFIFNNSVENHLKGIIYLPTREVVFNAASKLNTDESILISYRLILNNTDWNLKAFKGNAETANVKIRLVQ